MVQTMAERIVDYARVCMRKKNRVSPFERAAAREGMWFRGGVSRCDSWHVFTHLDFVWEHRN